MYHTINRLSIPLKSKGGSVLRLNPPFCSLIRYETCRRTRIRIDRTDAARLLTVDGRHIALHRTRDRTSLRTASSLAAGRSTNRVTATRTMDMVPRISAARSTTAVIVADMRERHAYPHAVLRTAYANAYLIRTLTSIVNGLRGGLSDRQRHERDESDQNLPHRKSSF